MKFSAVRSAVRSARAGPCMRHNSSPADSESPSASRQSNWQVGSVCRNASLANAMPQRMPASLVIMVALASALESMRLAVRSPVPTSSSSARVTVSVTYCGEIMSSVQSERLGYLICHAVGAGSFQGAIRLPCDQDFGPLAVRERLAHAGSPRSLPQL